MLGTVNFKKLSLGVLTQLLLSPSPWEIENISLALPASPPTSGREMPAWHCASPLPPAYCIYILIPAVAITQRKGQSTKMSSKCITHFVTILEWIWSEPLQHADPNFKKALWKTTQSALGGWILACLTVITGFRRDEKCHVWFACFTMY